MKLLGWMHRKFRQNTNEPFKDFSIGQSSLDDLQYPPKPNYCCKPLIKGQRDNQLRKSFASQEASKVDEEDLEDETSATLSKLFHGFLAIGTLGTDTDPSTPTFSISVENIMEKETEVTENELKLINDELEKVLGADESCNISSGRNSHVSAGRISSGRNSHVSAGRISSGRNSHVSTGRSSHCSSITLSGKPRDSTENNGSGTIVCPLQGYLLGSAIGLPETIPAEKKEHRTSLGELFQKTKLAEENSGAKSDRGEKKMEKETDKSAAFLVKKILKKKILHPSTRSTTAASGASPDSASAETKLHKMLHIFRRKVHPESSAAARKFNKTAKDEVKGDVTYAWPYKIEGSEPSAEDITITPRRAFSNRSTRRSKSQSNPPQLTLNGGNSYGNGEHWIKSDSDYLVLEL